ncbi:MAG: sigma-54-dependent Fis family transcriptional regulator [Planctomycetes bacterium]|nr:sigma-54-dependent Fis family transcriptional regulator [Planctomycetota bacterium]
MKILLADDEPSIRVTLSDDLRHAGHVVTVVDNGAAALEAVARDKFDCIITDVRMPRADGMQILRRSRELHPATAVIMITGYATGESAAQATAMGATDYIRKPFMNDEVLFRIDRIEAEARIRSENASLRAELAGRYQFSSLIGSSRPMQDVFRTLATVAPTDSNILVLGESGTGKELVANAIHHNSPRRDRPLVKMSCGALPETLIEDELFGHEKGAYTDAREAKAGRFEQANGGTVFLDDIDDISLTTQVKLLRVLQEREFERIGGTKTIKVSIRVVAASKIDLRGAVRAGRFREDLYHRLDVVTVRLPSLRERIEDIPLLIEHFVQRHGKGRRYRVDSPTLQALSTYAWPGNVRELQNAVERAIALAGESEVLRSDHLLAPADLTPRPEAPSHADTRTLREVLSEREKNHILAVLDFTQWHKARAAQILGISRKSLWEKLKEYGIDRETDSGRSDPRITTP